MTCNCVEKHKFVNGRLWFVTARNSNYSAFNGYRYTPSRYSAVRCAVCGASWRTKADYVNLLPDAPDNWWKMDVDELQEALKCQQTTNE